MAKYNVGDKVKVRSDLSGRHGASNLMAELWRGKVVTIDVVIPAPAAHDGCTRYFVREATTPTGVPYVWSDDMFEGLADTTAMPKLTTGMFGREDDGDLFVVAGDRCVYKSGEWENTNDPSWYYLITHLYDTYCFNEIEHGNPTVIWERKSEEVEENEDDTNVDNDTHNPYLDILRVVFGTNLKEVTDK